MIGGWRLGAAVTVAAVLALGYAGLRIDAAAYARGVRDQKILSLGETEGLNDRIEKAEAKARAAETAAADARRELHHLQLENAHDRARDPAAAGRGLPVSELRRVFRVP